MISTTWYLVNSLKSRLDPFSHICPVDRICNLGRAPFPNTSMSSWILITRKRGTLDPHCIALGRPEGVLGDEGQDDGEGDEGVQPGNVCWKDWRRHLEKSALGASLGGQVPRLTSRGTWLFLGGTLGMEISLVGSCRFGSPPQTDRAVICPFWFSWCFCIF